MVRGIWENVRTSNASPPFPITPLRPRMKSPAADCSSSMRLVQSSLPVHTRTCDEYAATVWRSDALRSISRSDGIGGGGEHWQVGEGHVGVYGISVGDEA